MLVLTHLLVSGTWCAAAAVKTESRFKRITLSVHCSYIVRSLERERRVKATLPDLSGAESGSFSLPLLMYAVQTSTAAGISSTASSISFSCSCLCSTTSFQRTAGLALSHLPVLVRLPLSLSPPPSVVVPCP